MARIELTLRIDESERAALENYSKVEGRPINQLLDEYIRGLIQRLLFERDQKERREANLAALREYRTKDPGFRRAIDAFVEAEASIEDPLEGEPVNGEFVDGHFKPGPVQSKIRELLGD